MKKISVFLLALAACLSFTACGSKKDKSTTKKSTTTQHTTTKSSDPDVKTITSKSLADVKTALDGKFLFSATINVEDSGSIEYMDVTLAVDTKGDVEKFAMLSEVGGLYIKEYSDTEYAIYSMAIDMDAYTDMYIDSKTSTADIIDIDEALSIACGLTIKYTTKNDNFSFISRNCTQYLYDYKQGSATITEQYVIDNATGICLKHSKVSSANPGVAIKDKTTFEATAFDLSTGVDSCFAGEETKILVKPYDTTFLKAHGLADVTGFNVDIEAIKENYIDTLPTIKLDYARADFVDGIQYAATSSYVLEGTDKVKSDFVVWLVSNLYSCGAKYDALCDEKGMFDLWYVDETTSGSATYDWINLCAYTNDIATYYLEINYSIDPVDEDATLFIRLLNTTLDPENDSKTYKQIDYDKYMETINHAFSMDVTIPDYDIASDTFTTYNVSLSYYEGSIIMTDSTGTLYLRKIGADQFKKYYYDEDVDEYKFLANLNQEQVNEIINIREQLEIALEKDILFTEKENNITYLNRNCTKFIYTSIDATDNSEIVHEYIIDKLTGICLKHNITVNDESTIDPTTFTVTGYFLDSADEKPVKAYFDAADDKIEPYIS